MTKAYLVLLLLIAPILTRGQGAFVSFDIKNTSTQKISVLNNDYANPDLMFGKRHFDISLSNGKANHTFKLSHPVFVLVFYRGDSTKAQSTYALYLSPGDGTFELSKAGYPMDRNILFKQLDEALKY